MLNIVLYEPEMPMNTGNIGRSCVATNTRLHLIEPLGFKLNDKMVKRAGLDYWPHLDVTVYSDFKDFLEKNPGARPYMATSDEFANRLLQEEKLALVPGTAFGDCGEGYLRVSYAYSLEDLQKAIERIKRFVARLDGKTEA